MTELNIAELHHLQTAGKRLKKILEDMWPNSQGKWELIIGWDISEKGPNYLNLGFSVIIIGFKQWDSLSSRFGYPNPKFCGFPIKIFHIHNHCSPVHPTRSFSDTPIPQETLDYEELSCQSSGSTTIEMLESSPFQVLSQPSEENLTCWGCRENQPNQQAHMDHGGCLYDSDF